jgi:hypothetical protein
MAKQRGRRHFGDDSQWKHGNDSQVPSSCGSDQKPKFHSQEQVGRFVSVYTRFNIQERSPDIFDCFVLCMALFGRTHPYEGEI